MERKSSLTRWLVILWLLVSQTAGAAMTFASTLVVTSFRGLGQQDANPMAFNILLVSAYIMPIVFIALVIWAWVTFFKSKDGTAALLSLASLLPGVLMQIGMRLYAP
jgi:hypothetical protein